MTFESQFSVYQYFNFPFPSTFQIAPTIWPYERPDELLSHPRKLVNMDHLPPVQCLKTYSQCNDEKSFFKMCCSTSLAVVFQFNFCFFCSLWCTNDSSSTHLLPSPSPSNLPKQIHSKRFQLPRKAGKSRARSACTPCSKTPSLRWRRWTPRSCSNRDP